MKIKSVDEVNAAMKRNRLRAFPNQKTGRKRLFPFARPQMAKSTPIANPSPKVFVAGSCLARQIDKSVKGAGLEQVYQRDKIGFGHTDAETKQNFNRYNLGVIENEFRWAFDPTADAGCASLIENDGELVDMQVVWTFAHQPEQARKIRRAYNADFASARHADLIIITLGAADMWYDSQTGCYLNGIVPNRISDAHPGRFELHAWEPEDFLASLERIRGLLQENTLCATPPRLAICVSPVSQPLSFSGEDALIAETYGKSVQRVAAQQFADRHDDVDYAPVYEFVVLTDRAFAYQSNSFNHVEPDCVDRFFGDYLQAVGAGPHHASAIAARGEALGLIKAGALPDAAAVLEAYLEEFGPNTVISDLHATLLPKLGRSNEIAETFLAHAQSGADTTWKGLRAAFRSAIGKEDRDTAADLLVIARGKLQEHGGATPAELETMASWEQSLATLEARLAEKQQLQELKQMLGQDPRAVADVMAEMKKTGFTLPQQHWLYAQALRRANHPEALAEFDEIVRSGSNYAKASSQAMIQMLSRKSAESHGFDLQEIRQRDQQLFGGNR